MVQGLGIDIVEIDRFKKAMERYPRIIDRLFTEEEQEYCKNRKRPHFHFAVRFAAKEAVLKSIKTGRNGVGWKDVEIKRAESGAPEIILHNNALKLEDERQFKILVSLSFSNNNAIASAMAVNN